MKSVLQKYAVTSACVLLTLTACGGSSETTSAITPGTKLAAATVVGNKAVFSGERANYTIVKSASGYAVIDNAGADGTTNLNAGAQRLQFTDVTVNTATAAQAQSIDANDLKTLIELYVAFFNRIPEADGLGFWIDRFRAGQSIDQISEDFYNAAIQYPLLTGYAVSMTPSEFVRIIYKNVLGRSGDTAPPEDDVQFWAGRITSGVASKGTLIRSMLDSAHTFQNDPTWGWVPALLNNKYTVGHYFAVQQGLNYNTPELSIQRTMDIAAAVTPQGIEAAIGRIPVTAGSPPLDPSGSPSLPAPAPAPTPVPTPAPSQASFTAALVNAPADNAAVRGSFRLEVRGTGIENVELLPPSSYTPVIARFNISADKTFAWLDIDTTTMLNVEGEALGEEIAEIQRQPPRQLCQAQQPQHATRARLDLGELAIARGQLQRAIDAAQAESSRAAGPTGLETCGAFAARKLSAITKAGEQATEIIAVDVYRQSRARSAATADPLAAGLRPGCRRLLLGY